MFNIGLEGNTVRTNFDIVAKVGPFTATTETFVATVTDGVLNVNLTVPYLSGGADQAKLSGLEVFAGNILSNGKPKSSNAAALRVFPNPAVDHFTVACTAGAAQSATLTLFDQLGRAVQNQAVRLQSGDNQVPVRTDSCPMAFTSSRCAPPMARPNTRKYWCSSRGLGCLVKTGKPLLRQ